MIGLQLGKLSQNKKGEVFIETQCRVIQSMYIWSSECLLCYRFICVVSVGDNESSQMTQFMSSYDNLMSDCHYIQCSPVASCAVQFPTPVSLPAIIALAPNINHSPQWQHAAVLPVSAVVNTSPSAAAAASVSGQVQWHHAGHAVAWQANDLSQPSSQPVNTDLQYVTVLFLSHSLCCCCYGIFVSKEYCYSAVSFERTCDSVNQSVCLFVAAHQSCSHRGLQ